MPGLPSIGAPHTTLRSVAAASSIRLVDCALKACKIKGEAAELPGDPDAASAGKESTPHGDMGSRADVLVTDLVDSR